MEPDNDSSFMDAAYVKGAKGSIRLMHLWLSRVKYGEYAAEFLWRYSTLKNTEKI
jgi:hypothetical protein